MSFLKKLGFLLTYIIPALVVLGYYWGGLWVFSGFVFAYLMIPLLDEIIGKDPENIANDLVAKISEDKYFEIIVYSMVYVQLGIVIWGAYVISLGEMSLIQNIGFLLSVMTFTSGGINIAHELGHKKSKFARFHSKLILMTVYYMHFYIEHNKGHHVHVATPRDPATSKKNQTFYAFWWQTVTGSFRSAWQIEIERLKRKNLAVWNPIHNQMLQFVIFPFLFFAALTWIFSDLQGVFIWQVPVFLLLQSFMAFSSLESVNYIEHYGIQRREISPGKYEKVNPLHSWNADHLLSNLMLFQLQRHSDHHAYAARPYQVLRHFDESPQLPFGYPVMIMMSLCPPLWFSVMNKRLEDWKAQACDAEHIAKVLKTTA